MTLAVTAQQYRYIPVASESIPPADVTKHRLTPDENAAVVQLARLYAAKTVAERLAGGTPASGDTFSHAGAADDAVRATFVPVFQRVLADVRELEVAIREHCDESGNGGTTRAAQLLAYAKTHATSCRADGEFNPRDAIFAPPGGGAPHSTGFAPLHDLGW